MSTATAAIVDSLTVNGYLQTMTDSQEQALLARIRNGDESGFALLVKEHTGKVTGLAWRLVGNREEAEDLAQEAFLRLHRSLPAFRGESRISTWLYRTTTRLAIDHLRRERIKNKLFFFRQDNDAPDPVELARDPGNDPAREFQSVEAMQTLRKSLRKLSSRQQVIFTLRHYEGLPLKEIAAHLGLQTGTVKAHLHRAVTQLRLDLAAYREDT
ncbi:MAG: sigma-70 family RNA polymerase sigma factor [Desulfuromonadales bacterium]|nr:sigma-70 family RNA polymerase sigma factor [Desulfuromonadales bacterium]